MASGWIGSFRRPLLTFYLRRRRSNVTEGEAVNLNYGLDDGFAVGMDGNEQDGVFATGEDVADDQGSHHPDGGGDVDALEA